MNELADAVKVTLGRRGCYVAPEKKFGGLMVTNDGATHRREIHWSDPFENLGAELAKTAATKTNDVAGDGTTTATVLLQGHRPARSCATWPPGRTRWRSAWASSVAADRVLRVLEGEGHARRGGQG